MPPPASRRSRPGRIPLLAFALGVLCAAGCAPASRPVRVLSEPLEPPPGRAETRTSLLYFGQLSDLHVTDAMSPLRIEMVDPAAVEDWEFSSAWRPQEVMSARVVDRAIRRFNARRRSEVPQGDGRVAEMAFALVTGDVVDNRQANELAWAVDLLAGRQVDPFSGQALAPGQCAGLEPEQRSAVDARATQRLYSGVQRYDDYPAETPPGFKASFWDPERDAPALAPDPSLDVPPELLRYAIPRIPGLLERALQPFPTAGLEVPFFVARGNHDSLIQGIYVEAWLESVYELRENGLTVAGCRKAWPNRLFDPYAYPFDRGKLDAARNAAIVKETKKMYDAFETPAVSGVVPPDARRAFVESPDYPDAFAKFEHGAGFGCVSDAVRQDSDSYAHYYTWDPTPGLRFISLDTNVQGDGAPSVNGNLDAPQYAWLEALLDETPATQLVVLFGHHTLGTMNNPGPDRCEVTGPGCNGDPRIPHTPEGAHLGCRPKPDGTLDCGAPYAPDSGTLRDLLLAYPNVILFVNGHTHQNRIESFTNGAGSGFWQVTTASVVEWPQETRTLELMDNRDGTLSVFATRVPVFEEPDPVLPAIPASGFSDDEVAVAARFVANRDIEWREAAGATAAGRMGVLDGRRVNIDGDVELVMKDPRPTSEARPQAPRSRRTPPPPARRASSCPGGPRRGAAP